MRLEVARIVDPEHPVLALCVGGLEHRRQPDRLDRGAALREVPHRREDRLRQALLGESATHRELVGEAVRGVRCEAREPEALRDFGDRRHGAVACEGQHRLDAVAECERLDRVGVVDVRDLRHVGVVQPLGLRIVVDGDDTMAETAHVDDRGALVAARADEKDSGHGAMLDEEFPPPGGIADGPTTIPACRSRASASRSPAGPGSSARLSREDSSTRTR